MLRLGSDLRDLWGVDCTADNGQDLRDCQQLRVLWVKQTYESKSDTEQLICGSLGVWTTTGSPECRVDSESQGCFLLGYLDHRCGLTTTAHVSS